MLSPSSALRTCLSKHGVGFLSTLLAPLARTRVVAPALFVVAGLYFLQGITANLELTDEGCIIYPIWRVSEGAIPYRDFRQLYGPSLFFVNAALFRLFGTDLLVIRLSLVVLKALVAVLVYLLARRVARRPFALIAYLLCVAVWGVPWWMLNSPYASHWAIALNLAALLTFLSLSDRPRAAGFAAGLFFGLATTFKQTTGVFGVTSLLVFLACETHAPSPGVRQTSRNAPTVRLATVLGAAGLFVVYLHTHLDSWSTLMLLAPIAATLLMRTILPLRAGTWSNASLSGLLPGVFAVIGMALPLLAYGAFYASHGSLAAVADNLVYGLPQRISRFVPLPAWGVRRPEWFSLEDPAGPQLRTMLSGLVLVAAFAAVRLWRNAHVTRSQPHGCGYRLAIGVCLLAMAAWFLDLSQTGGVARYIEDGRWLAEVNRLFFWIPLLLVWGSFASLLQMGDGRMGSPNANPTSLREALEPLPQPLSDADRGAESQGLLPPSLAGKGAGGLGSECERHQTRPVPGNLATGADGKRQTSHRLLHFHAAVGLLQLYPSADIWHVLMIFPIFLPLLAYELDWAREAHADTPWSFPGGHLPAALCVASFVWLALPYVNALVLSNAQRPPKLPAFSRATGVWDAREKLAEAAALVSYLRRATPPEQPLLVLSSEPALYFLAERVSALDNEEYTLYLIGTKLISEKDARELLDQTRIVARLEAVRPVVVDYAGSPASARFVATLPRVARYIRTHYRLVKAIGGYQVLRWSAS